MLIVKDPHTDLHTDQSGLQLSWVLTENYCTAIRVPMAIWELVYDQEPRLNGLLLDHYCVEELELKTT